MNKLNSRRVFLQKIGLGVAAMGGAGVFARAALAAPVDALVTGRGLIDRVASPANNLLLADRGDGNYYLIGNGLPDHTTGNFPNEHCPFPILARLNDTMMPMKITKNPQISAQPKAIGSWLFGIAVNGVVFDPAGPYWKGDINSGWHFEVLALGRPYLGIDVNNAHSQESGEYHYHGVPLGLVNRLQAEQARSQVGPKMMLIGYAADGFPIYAPLGHRDPRDPTSPLVTMRSSYQQKTGQRPSGSPGGRYDTAIFVQDYEYRPGTGDLDECNGRFGLTPEFPKGIYHYFVTSTFPFVPRQWKGTPDASFFHPAPGIAAVPKELQQLDYNKV